MYSLLLDVDECQRKTHNCHVKASCSNTEGSFKCTCKRGFVGDGENCTASKGLYSHDPAQSCKDIRDMDVSRNDGEYWIDPAKSGKPLNVFCDMTTDGGAGFLSPVM